MEAAVSSAICYVSSDEEEDSFIDNKKISFGQIDDAFSDSSIEEAEFNRCIKSRSTTIGIQSENNESSESRLPCSFNLSYENVFQNSQLGDTVQQKNVDEEQEDSDQSLHSIDFSNVPENNIFTRIINTNESGINDKEDAVSIVDTSDCDEPSVQVIEVPPEIINISSGEEDIVEVDVRSPARKKHAPLRQLRIDTFLPKTPKRAESQYVSLDEYDKQEDKVIEIRQDMLKCKNLLRTLNMDTIPDKGKELREKLHYLENLLKMEDDILQNMMINIPNSTKPKIEPVTWEDLQAKSNEVGPKNFGRLALHTFTMQKTLTMECLKNIHDSLATRPTEATVAEDPKGLKVPLMLHQKRALAWLIWRESQKPSGGILADDMGLGKTLTMISLLLKQKELKKNSTTDSQENKENILVKTQKKNQGGTLVICPASLLGQWEGEVSRRCRRNLMSVEIYHGATRDTSVGRLTQYDMVVTTYKLVMGELAKKGSLYKVNWERIILDEAHVIRNHKSQTSVAVCELTATSRWALTGTPVHNKELDMYALLKFLKCSPFDELQIWKRWADNKSPGGPERLNTIITSIMLRRTKQQLLHQGNLRALPDKKFEIIFVNLDAATKKLYQKMLIFSKTLFTQFLHQRTEKNVDSMYAKSDSPWENPRGNDEYYRLHKKILRMHGTHEVKSHEILVLLLRLRQICCHPSLITKMLNDEYTPDEGIDADASALDILEKLNSLSTYDEEIDDDNETDNNDFGSALNRILSSSNPVFDENRINGKICTTKELIMDRVLPQGDKIVIVSQWTGMLDLVARQLEKDEVYYDVLTGKVPVSRRNEIVQNFNDPMNKIKVLLLSLTAGGVGLNLIGANHLLLLDLHWNPQLESQAQDRIYRVGQMKTVFVYKIITTDTIEERINQLQERKLSMAEDVLTGTKSNANKLSLNDLKMLFNM